MVLDLSTKKKHKILKTHHFKLTNDLNIFIKSPKVRLVRIVV